MAAEGWVGGLAATGPGTTWFRSPAAASEAGRIFLRSGGGLGLGRAAGVLPAGLRSPPGPPWRGGRSRLRDGGLGSVQAAASGGSAMPVGLIDWGRRCSERL